MTEMAIKKPRAKRQAFSDEDVRSLVRTVISESAAAVGLTADEIAWVRTRIKADAERALMYQKVREEIARKGAIAILTAFLSLIGMGVMAVLHAGRTLPAIKG